MKNNVLKKNFIWNIVGSAFNSFLSLFFLIIVTRINGIDEAGIFSFCFSTSCLFYIIGIYSGRVYQVTDDDKEIFDSDYIFCKFFSCLFMLLLSLIFCFIRAYDLHKFIILIFLVVFKMCEAFSETLYAIIQEHNKLHKVGKSLFLKALFGLTAFVLIDYFTLNLTLSVASLVIINIIFIIFYDFKNIRDIGFKLKKINFKRIYLIFKRGFCTFAFTFLTQYVINSSRYVIDAKLADNMQTIFGILIMPATVLVLLGQFVIHPFLISLKEKYHKGKKEFFKITMELSLAIIVLGIFATIAAYLFGIPILSFLYNINLNDYLLELVLVIIGATFYEVSVIFSTSLITMRSTFSQLIIFVVVSILSYFSANYFVLKLEIFGAIISYMVMMFILMILYFVVFLFILKRAKVGVKE